MWTVKGGKMVFDFGLVKHQRLALGEPAGRDVTIQFQRVTNHSIKGESHEFRAEAE